MTGVRFPVSEPFSLLHLSSKRHGVHQLVERLLSPSGSIDSSIIGPGLAELELVPIIGEPPQPSTA